MATENEEQMAEFKLTLVGASPEDADEIYDAIFDLMVDRCGCAKGSTACRFNWVWGGSTHRAEA